VYRLALMVLALALSVSVVSISQARDTRGGSNDDWVRLFVQERSRIDVIDVQPKMGRFDKIRIIAVNDAIYVKSVRLRTSGGRTSDVTVDRVIAKDSASVVIDLPGERDTIASAEVEYKVRLPSSAYVAIEGLVSGEPGGYEVLESKILDTKDDVVTLRVEGNKGPVSSIRLRAWVQQVNVRRAEIVFGNGDRQEVRLRDRLEPGQATDPINVDGRTRNIKSVVLTLRPQRGEAERARIDLLGKVEAADYGRRGRDGRDDRRDGRRGDNDLGRDWQLLGTGKAAIFSKDDDRIKVGKSAGLFKSIRIRARGEDVRMYGMKIRYGNGSVEEVPVYGTLAAGQITQPFDLKGRSRYIEEITFKYRTKLNIKGPAEVELWGQESGR